MGRFIADFAYAECRLLVELDGEPHLQSHAKDALRTDALEDLGWKVLRIWNTEVCCNLDGVEEFLIRICDERLREAVQE